MTEPAAPEPTATAHDHAHPGYLADKEAVLRRIRKIEGQARGIARMVEDETYCIDVLTQISAINSALKSVAIQLVDDHLRHCVADALRSGDDASEKIDEATAALARLVRS